MTFTPSRGTRPEPSQRCTTNDPRPGRVRLRIRRAGRVLVRALGTLVLVGVYVIVALVTLVRPPSGIPLDSRPIGDPLGTGWSSTGSDPLYPVVALPDDRRHCPGSAEGWQRNGSTTDLAAVRVYHCTDAHVAARVLALGRGDGPSDATTVPDGFVADGLTVLLTGRGADVLEVRTSCEPSSCDPLAAAVLGRLSAGHPGAVLQPAGRLDLLVTEWDDLYLAPLLLSWLLFIGTPDLVRWVSASRFAPAPPYVVAVDRAARRLRRRTLPRLRGVVRLSLFLLSVQFLTALLFPPAPPGTAVAFVVYSAALAGTGLRRGGLAAVRRAGSRFRHHPMRETAAQALRLAASAVVVALALFCALTFDVALAGGQGTQHYALLFLHSDVAELARVTAENTAAVAVAVPVCMLTAVSLDRSARRVRPPERSGAPAVLYLRDFADDMVRVPTTALSRRGFIEQLSPWRARSMAEVIVGHARVLGPVRQARFPDGPGPARPLGVDSIRLGENWPDEVCGLAETALCVVVHATPAASAVGDGLAEELEILGKRIKHHRIVFLLGPARPAAVDRRWDMVCRTAEKHERFADLGVAGLRGAAIAVIPGQDGTWLTFAARRKSEWTYAAAFAEIEARRGARWRSEAAGLPGAVPR